VNDNEYNTDAEGWRVELWSPDGVLVVVSNYHEGATIPDDLGEDLREAIDNHKESIEDAKREGREDERTGYQRRDGN
jgi:hypothetical protein